MFRQTSHKYEGGSICNENPSITPSTNVLGSYAICQTKDQSVAVKMVYKTLFYLSKGALAWYGKLTWESAHAWILIVLCYLIVRGITLIFMVRLNFYAIPLLIYDVMNDITRIP